VVFRKIDQRHAVSTLLPLDSGMPTHPTLTRRNGAPASSEGTKAGLL
jgi:hypothetical protein